MRPPKTSSFRMPAADVDGLIRTWAVTSLIDQARTVPRVLIILLYEDETPGPLRPLASVTRTTRGTATSHT